VEDGTFPVGAAYGNFRQHERMVLMVAVMGQANNVTDGEKYRKNRSCFDITQDRPLGMGRETSTESSCCKHKEAYMDSLLSVKELDAWVRLGLYDRQHEGDSRHDD